MEKKQPLEMTEQEAMRELVDKWMDYMDVWLLSIREGDTPQSILSILTSFA